MTYEERLQRDEATRRSYYVRHREQMKAYQKAYRQSHKEKAREYRRKYKRAYTGVSEYRRKIRPLSKKIPKDLFCIADLHSIPTAEFERRVNMILKGEMGYAIPQTGDV